MKKFFVILLVIAFLTIPLLSDENEVIEKASQYFRAKEFDKALQVIDDALKVEGASENLKRLKLVLLIRMEKFDEGLSYINKWIQTAGESPEFLMQKLYLQIRIGKFNDALKTALRKEEIVKEKNPFDCMDIVECYSRLKNYDKAFEWLNKAIDRGFTSLKALETSTLKPLTEDPRFAKIQVRVKNKIGLGKKAKDFTLKLYPIGDFQLSKQEGKVILVDFWATWCGPCIREIPNLKKYYQDFKNKGFEIIGISLDRDPAKFKEYIAKEKLPWKIAFSGKFWDDPTARQYGIRAIPSYWLIDKKGVLRHFNLRGGQLKKAIEELLAE
jgi:peroxiredoxin